MRASFSSRRHALVGEHVVDLAVQHVRPVEHLLRLGDELAYSTSIAASSSGRRGGFTSSFFVMKSYSFCSSVDGSSYGLV